jgi:hypothetical protein
MNKLIFTTRYRFAYNDEDPKNYDPHTAVPTENIKKINSLFTDLHPKLEFYGDAHMGFQLDLI